MGTSASSNGSPSRVPMVPPWVPDVPSPPEDGPQPQEPIEPTEPSVPLEGVSASDGSEVAAQPPIDDKVRLAPSGRFGGTRLNLSSFARHSDRAAMRRGIGQYIRQGYGGSSTATRRMGGTIRSSQALFSAVSGAPGNPFQAPGGPLDPAVLAGQSAQEIMNAVTDAVQPVDGTQDAESSRAAIQDALADTLDRFPNADLLNLNGEQKGFVLETYVANDVYGRVFLDVGQDVIKNAPSYTAGLSRLKEIRDYIREAVASSFRELSNKGTTLSRSNVASVVREAIRETFFVFEVYA